MAHSSEQEQLAAETIVDTLSKFQRLQDSRFYEY